MTDRYVPAAGRKSFQSLYDQIVALTMREGTFRGNFIGQVLDGEDPADLVIADVGAGTGTLAIAFAESGANVIAVDGDPAALATARRKDGAAAVDFREGLADDLPIADGSEGRLKDRLSEGGFGAVSIESSLRTGWGRVEMLSARSD